MPKTTHPKPDPTRLDPALLKELENDEDYWDYLDEMEHRMGGCREWDNIYQGEGP